MIFTLRILTARIRRTLNDYRTIWRPDDRSRLAHLRNKWRASEGLVIADREANTIYEVPF